MVTPYPKEVKKRNSGLGTSKSIPPFHDSDWGNKGIAGFLAFILGIIFILVILLFIRVFFGGI